MRHIASLEKTRMCLGRTQIEPKGACDSENNSSSIFREFLIPNWTETIKGKPLKKRNKKSYAVVISLIRMRTCYRGNILKYWREVRTTSKYLHVLPKNQTELWTTMFQKNRMQISVQNGQTDNKSFNDPSTTTMMAWDCKPDRCQAKLVLLILSFMQHSAPSQSKLIKVQTT